VDEALKDFQFLPAGRISYDITAPDSV